MLVKKEIGMELKRQLEVGYNKSRIANWAFNFYSDKEGSLTPELQEVLIYLASIDEGGGFEATEERLHLLTRRLLENEKDFLKGFFPELEFKIKEDIDKSFCCRVCGKENDPRPWGEDGKTPLFDLCDCCSVTFGYQDCDPIYAKKYREEWLKNGAKWGVPRLKPKNWVLEEQLKQIPDEFK